VEEVSDPHRPARRGRPRLGYRLTATGQQTAGDNFHDLATVLWQEIRGVRAPEVRRGLLGRIGKALAATYSEQVSGSTPLQRIDSVAGLLRDRGVVCSVAEEAAADGSILPVLTTHSCPYPDLAEHDRGICAAEQTMLEDLVGEPVRLTDCRLDGGDCCRFEVSSGASLPENPAASMVQQSQRRSAVDGRQPS
jgi:predicted ArsR family transcriptional regulator